MSTPRPIPAPSPWAGHARACLVAAMRHDAVAAQAAANALLADFGPGVIPQVMLAWIDTALSAQGIGPGETGQPARIVFGDIDTGNIATDAHDVAPEVAWAGRLMNARIANDRDTYQALMNAVPPDQDGRYINSLLDCCAQSARLGRAMRGGDGR